VAHEQLADAVRRRLTATLEIVALVRRPITVRPSRKRAASRQFIEECPCVFQDRRVETFGEPALDWCEEVPSLRALALVEPKPSESRERHWYGRSPRLDRPTSQGPGVSLGHRL